MAVRGVIYRLKWLLSFLSLLAERLWSSFWAVATLVFFYAALALTNVLFYIGIKAHAVLLVAFIAGIVFAAKKLGTPFRFPNKPYVERRIETESGLAHRPLETLQDKPVNGMGADIWAAHIRRTQESFRGVKTVQPRPTAAKQDPYGLRTAALILFVIGLVVAGDAATQRLRDSLTPDVFALMDQKPVALDVWITPPDYTKAPTVFLATAQLGTTPEKGIIKVPQGSIVKVRLSGYSYAPSFAYGGVKVPFTKAADKSFTLETKIEKSGEMKITQWWVRSLGKWNVRVTPDNPPTISLLMTDKTPRSALKISYSANDDYGIRRITATFTPLPEMVEKIGTKTYTFNIPVSVSTKNVLTHVEDLAPHILAGNVVMMTLAAEDNAGNVTVSDEKSVLLPEREFTNPSAQKIIAERKRLLWFNNSITRRLAMENLASVANQPVNYKGDIVVFMALASSIKRLVYDGYNPAAVETLQGLLWDIALKIEDGGLSMAARELSDSLQKLSEALNDPASTDEQLQELAENVQRKMMEYMQSMANEMQQRMAEGKKTPEMSPELAEKFMQHIDMGEMMKQLQEMSKGNGREQMQKMAEFMKNALDNLDMKKMDEMQEGQQKAMEALQKLEDLVKKQQMLMDKTAKKKPGEKSDPENKEQQEIRDQLGEATRDMAEFMPELPESLGKADQAMKEAQKKLSENKGQEYLPFQKTALEELQKGMDQSMAQMAQQMKQMIMSFGMMPKGNKFGEGYDPLGREDGKAPPTGEIELPDEKERRRVQQIIKELRERSNDFERPKVEREYIDRLLEMFY